MAQNVSDRFLRAIRESGERFCVADLYYKRSTTPVVSNLPVVSGSITIDGGSAQRRSGTVTLAATELLSADPTASLQPYGLEIRLRMGVKFPDGEELVNLGIFAITDLSFSEEEGNIPTCTLADRSYFISDQSSQTGVEDYSNTSTIAAIKDLLTKSIFVNVNQYTFKQDPVTLAPGQVALIVDTTSVSDIKIPGGSPMNGGSFWDDCQLLAASLGAELFFEADGVNVILRKIPDITTATSEDMVVRTVDTGENGTLVTAARVISRDGSYNAVQATGALPANATATASPPTVFVYDANPDSATFYDIVGGTDSGYGRRVFPMSSDTITDKAQLLVAATAKLKSLLGLSRSLSLTMLPDPALDCGDIIKVSFLDQTEELHMVTQITLDLTGGSMGVQTKTPNQINVTATGSGMLPEIDGNIQATGLGPNKVSYYATWSKSYTASGTGISSSYLWQGDNQKGSTNRKSLIGFDYAQIQSDLIGQTITGCTLRIHYKNWWYDTGTAIFGTHTSTSQPGSYPGGVTANRVHTGSWYRNSFKTISLGQTVGEEFAAGTSTGIAIGPGPSTSRVYHGYASGYVAGDSHRPVLTIYYE